MSAQLIVQSLTCSYGPDVVVANASFTIAPSDRVGVIGPNGSGKSTLLRALAGKFTPVTGNITAPDQASVVFMDQQIEVAQQNETVESWLRLQSGVHAAEVEFERAAQEVSSSHAANDRYDRALNRLILVDPAGFEHRMPAMLARVGLHGALRSQPVNLLSGGQRTRLQLAAIGLNKADVLLLDEPTNDLDGEGLELLGQLLADRQDSTVVVSHDRVFLSSFVTSILELDGHDHSIKRYGGGYQSWSEERERAHAEAVDAHRDWVATRDVLKERARRHRDWSAKGVAAAKRADEPDRNVRQAKIEAGEKGAAKASRTVRALQRHEEQRVHRPWEGWELRMQLAEVPSAGSDVARLDAAIIRRGDFVLGPVNVSLQSGDRVLLTGANGSGKTTLIGALVGDLPIDSGRRYLGPGAVIGQMGQSRKDLGNGPLLDAFVESTALEQAPARSVLAKFGLSADQLQRSLPELSPGEVTRATLAVLSARGTNTLVLDEPTNHLDLEAVEQLESALRAFGGTLLLVTHDRRMIEVLDVTRQWHLAGGKLSVD